jgi:hypothetical protein
MTLLLRARSRTESRSVVSTSRKNCRHINATAAGRMSSARSRQRDPPESWWAQHNSATMEQSFYHHPEELNLRLNRIASFLWVPAMLLLISGCSSTRSPANEPAGGGAAETVFADEISLTGYSIRNKDGHTEVELRWKALRQPAADYYAFVHVLDGAGGMAFQADHPLKNSTGAATSAWKVGEAVEDRFSVAPPPNHSPGTYTLRIGVYVANPMKVLQLTKAGLPQPTDGWKNQSIILANVECK